MKKILFLCLLALANCKTPGNDDGPSPDPIPDPKPTVTPNPKPEKLKIDGPEWVKIKAGSEVALQVLEKKDESYVWSTGESGAKIWIKPAASASYVVTAVHSDGRSVSKIIKVIIE